MENLTALLRCPVPLALIQNCGFPLDSRYIACFWETSSESLTVWDGLTTHSEPLWWPFLLYLRHPEIIPHLRPFDLGTADSEATDAVLLDRRQGRLYAGPIEEVLKVVREHAWETRIRTRLRRVFPDAARERIAREGLTAKDRALLAATVDNAPPRQHSTQVATVHALVAGIRGHFDQQPELCGNVHH